MNGNPPNEGEKDSESQADDCGDDAALALVEGDDAPKIAQILEAIPAEHRADFRRIISASFSHSGWLPTPGFLDRYEQILPGLAERIVAMPEREQAHRHKVIEATVKDDTSLKMRGQTFAMVSLILLLIMAGVFVALGQYAWAGRIVIFGIIGVVGIFVTGKWADAKIAKSSNGSDDEE